MGGLHGGTSSIGGGLRRCASARLKAESSDSDVEQQGLRCSVPERGPHGRSVPPLPSHPARSHACGHAFHEDSCITFHDLQVLHACGERMCCCLQLLPQGVAGAVPG